MKTRNYTQTKSTLAAIAGLALITASANAVVTVNYNFGTVGALEAGLEGPAGGLGETWSQGNGNATNLLDSANDPTGVNVTLAGGSLFTSPATNLSMLDQNYWVTGGGTP